MGFGLGKAFKKFVSKAVNKVTGGNATLNKIIGVGLAPVTGGASLSVTNQATRMQEAHEARKEAAQEAAQEAVAQKKAADNYKARILGQRASRIEDALSSQTDYTGDEDVDPRHLVERVDVSKKKKLIGF